MSLKMLAVLFFVAVSTALPLEDPKVPEKISGPVLLVPKHGPKIVLDSETGPTHLHKVELDLADAPHNPKIELDSKDLKTDATNWGYYKYPYNQGYYNQPSYYSHGSPSYYTYWSSYW